MSIDQQYSLTDYGVGTVDRRKQLARWVSNVLCPPVFGLTALLLVAQTQKSTAGWLWILFYMGVAILMPVLYVLWLLQKKEITDFHLKLRQQRIKPMLVMVFCSGLAWIVMSVGSAPIFLQTLAITGAVLIAFLLIVTLRWKISGHATAVTAFALFSLSYWGALALPILLLVPTVIWARLALKRHTLAQTLAGVTVGGIFMVLVQHGVTLQCSGAYFSCG
jgi:hypothetical protein